MLRDSHNLRGMKRQRVKQRHLSAPEFEAWVITKGGVKAAAKLIAETLECSESKAAKLAGGRYPSMLTAAEQVAMEELTDIPREVLFGSAPTGKKSKAS